MPKLHLHPLLIGGLNHIPNYYHILGTYLIEELFASGARLDGKLQLCVHGGHTDIHLHTHKGRHFGIKGCGTQVFRGIILHAHLWQ